MKNSMTHAFCYLLLFLLFVYLFIIYNFLAKLSCLLLEDNDIRYHS